MGQPEDSLLWNVLGRRDAAGVRRALARGASPNARGRETLYGRDTALSVATSLADAPAVEALLDAGARQVPGRHKMTPLVALVHRLSAHQACPDQALACLDRLLARRPSLEPEGGDPVQATGNVIEHLLRQCRLPVDPDSLAEQMLDRVLQSAQRKKRFSDDFSASVLLAAFNFHTPELFSRLVGMGLQVAPLDRYAAGLAYRLVSVPALHSGLCAEAWWDTLARHDVPAGAGGPGIDATRQARAQAELARRRLEQGLPAPAAGSVPRQRF